MRKLREINLAIVSLLLLLSGCVEKPVGPVAGEKTVSIKGRVLRSDNGTPVAGALVSLGRPARTDTTDASGRYTFGFESDSSYSTTIIITRAGFAPDTFTVSISPGKDITQPDALLKPMVAGLPDQSHFTMTVEKLNFPGLSQIDATNTIRVRVGDKFGNPVAAGTKINFSSHGGIMEEQASTDNTGFAQARLFGGNPQPVDPVYGRGFTWVRASTTGEGGTTVQDSVLVLFSGTTQITGPASGFTLRDGGTQSFEYFVADENGNPLVAGTSIGVSVTGSADVKIEGNVSVNLTDTQDKTRFTRFSFTLTDTRPLDNAGNQSLSITISVTGGNGNRTYTFTGTLLAPDVSGGGASGVAATIALIQVSRNAISVREVGGDETSIVTFEVRDSLGRPVDQSHQVTVAFLLNGSALDGVISDLAYVAPASSLTDVQTGRVQTTVNSGTKAGVLQVVAQVIIGSRTIRSAPVVIDVFGGFPVSSHFSVGVAKLNFPGWDRLNEINTINVLAGDKWSNPVKPGTAVYFSTTGGVISASAYTGDQGNASATLLSGNPRPIDPVLGAGFGRVAATTVGQFGETVRDEAVVLFSGTSEIKNVTPTSFAVPSGGSSGPISFEVSDQNGNPLTAGTTITVALQYTAPPNTTINLNVTGDVNITLGDTQAKGQGTTNFTFQVVDQTVGGVPTSIPVTVVITVTSPNGNPPKVSVNGTVG
jgi:hypothetical protein